MIENVTFRTILLSMGVIMLGICLTILIANWDGFISLLQQLLERKTIRM